jgi:hypothetical protein
MPCNAACPLCLLQPESCSFSLQVWAMMLHKLEITFNSQSRDAAYLGLCCQEQLVGRTEKKVRSWNAVITLVWWSVWKERNASPSVVFSKIFDEAPYAGRSLAGQLANRL